MFDQVNSLVTFCRDLQCASFTLAFLSLPPNKCLILTPQEQKISPPLSPTQVCALSGVLVPRVRVCKRHCGGVSLCLCVLLSVWLLRVHEPKPFACEEVWNRCNWRPSVKISTRWSEGLIIDTDSQTEECIIKHMLTNQKDGDALKRRASCCTALISLRLRQSSKVSPSLASPPPCVFLVFHLSSL